MCNFKPSNQKNAVEIVKFVCAFTKLGYNNLLSDNLIIMKIMFSSIILLNSFLM